MAWGFISSLYEAYWDKLFINNKNTSFRNKVKAQFSPQIIKDLDGNKGKNSVKPSYILVLPPPIPAKSPKKVNEISKFFLKKSHF